MTAPLFEFALPEPGTDFSVHPLVDRTTEPTKQQLGPEKKLMLAVLEGAVRDFKTYAASPAGRGRRIFRDADAWFHSPDAGPFTFETICHAVGLDPDFVRGGLRRWQSEPRRQLRLVRPTLGVRQRVASPSESR